MAVDSHASAGRPDRFVKPRTATDGRAAPVGAASAGGPPAHARPGVAAISRGDADRDRHERRGGERQAVPARRSAWRDSATHPAAPTPAARRASGRTSSASAATVGSGAPGPCAAPSARSSSSAPLSRWRSACRRSVAGLADRGRRRHCGDAAGRRDASRRGRWRCSAAPAPASQTTRDISSGVCGGEPERPVAGEQLVEQQAERVDVGGRRHRLAADLLGARVVRASSAAPATVSVDAAVAARDRGSWRCRSRAAWDARRRVTSTLPGFRSRCTMWCSCACCTASSTARHSRSAVGRRAADARRRSDRSACPRRTPSRNTAGRRRWCRRRRAGRCADGRARRGSGARGGSGGPPGSESMPRRIILMATSARTRHGPGGRDRPRPCRRGRCSARSHRRRPGARFRSARHRVATRRAGPGARGTCRRRVGGEQPLDLGAQRRVVIAGPVEIGRRVPRPVSSAAASASFTRSQCSGVMVVGHDTARPSNLWRGVAVQPAP